MARSWKLFAGLLTTYFSIVSVENVLAAENDSAPPHQLVRFGDLNLEDSRGVAIAYGRLVWAAERVCAGADSADYWVRETAIPCITDAVSRAIDSIGAPRLTAYAQTQRLFRTRRAETLARAH